MFDKVDEFILHQIYNLLRYESKDFKLALQKSLPRTIERYSFCLAKKNIKHFPKLVYYHADEWASFIYFASNEIFLQTKESEFAEKLYLLNRYLNSLDIFYDRNLPEIFHLEHPIGTIVGRATIGNYCVIHQGVTIGGNLDLDLPIIGENVSIYTDAKIIGKCVIGNNCQIGSGATLYNENLKEGQTLVQVNSNKKIISKRNFKNHFFKVE